MATKKRKYNLSNSVKDRIAPIWGVLISGITIFSTGFGAGVYISSAFYDMKNKDEDFEHKQELLDIKSEYEDKIHELREQVYLLQKETLGNEEK